MGALDFMPLSDEKCFEEFFRAFLGMKANGVPWYFLGRKVVFDVQDIILGLAEPS